MRLQALCRRAGAIIHCRLLGCRATVPSDAGQLFGANLWCAVGAFYQAGTLSAEFGEDVAVTNTEDAGVTGNFEVSAATLRVSQE